jgi:hypothetical protein
VLRDNAAVKASSTGVLKLMCSPLHTCMWIGGPAAMSFTRCSPRLCRARLQRMRRTEVRCKALSDSALTYRFLLCRVNLIDQVSRLPRGVQALSSLGGAAYYILSDGREEGSTVKLTFEPH